MDLRTPGGLLMVPAVVVLGHGLLYAFTTVLLGLAGLGIGGLVVLGMVSEGSTEALPGLVVLTGMGGFTVALMLAMTVVMLVFGGMLLWGAIRGLQNRGSPAVLGILGLLSFAFCGLFALLTLMGFNPLFVLWGLASVLSLVAGIVALVATPSVT